MKRSASALSKSESWECRVEVISITKSKFVIVYQVKWNIITKMWFKSFHDMQEWHWFEQMLHFIQNRTFIKIEMTQKCPKCQGMPQNA